METLNSESIEMLIEQVNNLIRLDVLSFIGVGLSLIWNINLSMKLKKLKK